MNAPRGGFEPPAVRLTAGCSATELPRNILERHELHLAGADVDAVFSEFMHPI